MQLRPLFLALALSLALPAAGGGQIPIFERGGVLVELGGYAISMTGLQYPALEVGTEGPQGFNGEVVRLRWRGRIGERAVVEVHNRLFWRLTSGDVLGGATGLGVSAVPERTLDLDATLIDRNGALLRHDIDRLAVTFYAERADVTIGRQAITWGVASLFPVADLWAQFSPFELDTEQKPGIDAARALIYPGGGVELDLVVADRGSLEHLSAGARATIGLAQADVYAAFGKFWDELIPLAGVSAVLSKAKLRAEAALPWGLDEAEFLRPRATVGVDYLGGSWTAGAEYHYNGLGVDEPADYFARLGDPRLLRGESYFLGRHYIGAVAAYTGGGASVSIAAITNLGDPSVILTPLLSYEVGQNASVSFGAFQGWGRQPEAVLPPVLNSEFGSYGDTYFTRVAVFF